MYNPLHSCLLIDLPSLRSTPFKLMTFLEERVCACVCVCVYIYIPVCVIIIWAIPQSLIAHIHWLIIIVDYITSIIGKILEEIRFAIMIIIFNLIILIFIFIIKFFIFIYSLFYFILSVFNIIIIIRVRLYAEGLGSSSSTGGGCNNGPVELQLWWKGRETRAAAVMR